MGRGMGKGAGARSGAGFQAVDGEGADGPDGRHVYAFLACVGETGAPQSLDGTRVRRQAGQEQVIAEQLPMRETLPWLCDVLEQGRRDDAAALVAWVEAQAHDNGEMPEQVEGHVLDESYVQHWIERWGTSACPLLWSHGMHLILKAKMNNG